MATSIGGTACNYLKGRPAPPRLGPELVNTRRPGVDGMVSEKLGLRGGGFVLVATQIDTAANITIWQNALDALRATFVTVETDDGEVYTNCLIMDVILRKKRAAVGAGSADTECVQIVVGDRSAT